VKSARHREQYWEDSNEDRERDDSAWYGERRPAVIIRRVTRKKDVSVKTRLAWVQTFKRKKEGKEKSADFVGGAHTTALVIPMKG